MPAFCKKSYRYTMTGASLEEPTLTLHKGQEVDCRSDLADRSIDGALFNQEQRRSPVE
jgi:hypothetical protein